MYFFRTSYHIFYGVMDLSAKGKEHDRTKKAAAYVFSAACGAVSSAVMTAAFAAVMYILGLPPRSAGTMSFFAFAAGCFVCGFVCGSIKKRRGLVIGAVCALIMTAVTFGISLAAGEITAGTAWIKPIAALAASCTGAVWGVNRRMTYR